jgi:hypothetical protein
MPDNNQENKTVQKDGYELTFNQAFSSRSVVKGPDGQTIELYRQQGVYHLPSGQSGPPKNYQIVFRGGPQNRNASLDIQDPKNEIARIVVEFYAEGHRPGTGSGDASVETLTVDNDSTNCPPTCG